MRGNSPDASPYETVTATWIDASGGIVPDGALTFGEELLLLQTKPELHLGDGNVMF